eukprot:TRINITY_DN109542_c0_g1_i1.p1 TRINITY_DN109542_c0_g1~~TRINITY_DN109542_c0_g1_i1.p1  ORF type:complete len:299 (+),score=50.21 TRINITY_DN109542_c0_g1_i1:90-986(+)
MSRTLVIEGAGQSAANGKWVESRAWAGGKPSFHKEEHEDPTGRASANMESHLFYTTGGRWKLCLRAHIGLGIQNCIPLYERLCLKEEEKRNPLPPCDGWQKSRKSKAVGTGVPRIVSVDEVSIENKVVEVTTQLVLLQSKEKTGTLSFKRKVTQGRTENTSHELAVSLGSKISAIVDGAVTKATTEFTFATNLKATFTINYTRNEEHEYNFSLAAGEEGYIYQSNVVAKTSRGHTLTFEGGVIMTATPQQLLVVWKFDGSSAGSFTAPLAPAGIPDPAPAQDSVERQTTEATSSCGLM